MTFKTLFTAAMCFISCVACAAPTGSRAPVSNVKKETAAVADTVGKQPAAEIKDKKDLEHGKATFYSKKWHGRRTSSGQKLDNYDYQCAHKTLPFGTLVKVTNKKNGKSCVVKVVDRGPFARGMVIDLTHQAAKHIGMLGDGVVHVSLETIDPDTKVVNGEIVETGESVEIAEAE